MADPTPLDSTPLRRQGNRVPAAVRDSLMEDLSPLFGRAFKTATAEGVRKHAFPSRLLTALRASAPEGAGPGREDPGLSSASAVHAARHFPALISLLPTTWVLVPASSSCCEEGRADLCKALGLETGP